MTYRLLTTVRVEESETGIFLVSQRPYRVLRVNQRLAGLARQSLLEPVAANSSAETKVWESLVEKGMAERVGEGGQVQASVLTVSVIIPVKDRAEELAKCLQSIKNLNYPVELIETIVVDDGSSDESPRVAERFGARVVHTGGAGKGPAAARNCGVAVAGGEILAFIDSDCTACPEWLNELLPSFADPVVAAVGGWVDGMNNGRALDRYEAVMSSLNLGGRERSGKEGKDTFYLPSCNLLVRRKAFQVVGGFRQEMHVGEDVDLTWRLRDCAYKIVYLPRGRVFHDHRSRIIPFMNRRFDYGTSEGTLQTLHPERRKRMVLPPGLCVALLLLMIGLSTLRLEVLGAFVAVLALDGLWTWKKLSARRLRQGIGAVFLARIRAFASLSYYLGYHIVRYYLVPVTLMGALLPKIGVIFLLLGCWTLAVDYAVRRPRLNPFSFALFYLLEQFAYGCGVFAGCWRERNFSSYRFEF